MILPLQFSSLLARFSSPPPCSSIALVWWGTWLRGATLGDRLAVDNLSHRLTEAGLPHNVLSHPNHAGDGHLATSHPFALAPQISTLVFVCGPLVGTKRVRRLLRCCRHSTVLAAGVSLLEQQQVVNQRLDGVVARDGVADAFFDLAVESFVPAELREGPKKLAKARIGICLRGPQKDYGTDRDQSRLAESLIETMVNGHPAAIERIDTVLAPDNQPGAILEQIRSVDLLLTTRLHGSLLALASGVPVIALDQIVGGGKLTEVLGRTGWPHCFLAEHAHPQQLRILMAQLLEHPPVATIDASQQSMQRLTDQALSASVEMIKAAI